MLMKTGAVLETSTSSAILLIECIHSQSVSGNDEKMASRIADRENAEPLVGSAIPPASASTRVAASGKGRLGENRILIVDDCTLYRENLAFILAADGIKTLSAAWDLPSLLSALRSHAPDVVLLSTTTRDSATLLRETLEISPGTKVIVLGLAEDDESGILSCAAAGAVGFHLKKDSLDELLTLLREVPSGESFLPPRVTKMLLQRLSTGRPKQHLLVRELVLTTREAQVLRMLRMGLSNRDISIELDIAIPTVKNHVHRVLTKLGVRTRAEAAALPPGLLPYLDG
ncbi:hypothetical protein MSAR_27950 [Mycolicibacterium sarraceniae]|uniref:DNA-binding response regulator n=2 Tax=Mycolicibacterium sarraceniae TaxID=1534348 RepID=A0A7I7STZ8_9MYCO|nr:hypothetical protein MSAR_27950 [Mycolicibacterium sarraceniae]